MPELTTAGRGERKATSLNVEALRAIIQQLIGTTSTSDTSTGGRFRPLHEKIRHRTEHFHNLPQADPQLPAPYDSGPKYQSDILRRTHVQLKARQTENAPLVRVAPARQSPKQQKLADNFEMVRNRIFDLVQERQGQDIAGALYDGLNIHCYGIVHWQKAPDVWPDMPDPDVTDELPDESEERERYRSEKSERGYEETDDSLQDRAKRAKAGAGAPWYVDVIHPDSFAFIEDRSQAMGMALALVVRRVPMLEYSRKLESEDKLYLSLHDVDKKVAIYEERSRPQNWTPSGGDANAWGKDLLVAEVWTRDEYYELVSHALVADWVLVKSFAHPYKMPPFALAYGNRHNSPDPALAYEPLMEGLYRLKPFHDHDMALLKVLAEETALPYLYIKQANGAPLVDAVGKPIFLTKNALSAQTMPEGASIEKLEFEINPAFLGMVQDSREELGNAAPSTGAAEVSATTQAWAIRLQQAQASVEVADSIKSVARALRTMHRNMAMVESLPVDEGGFGEPIWVYGKTKAGVIDRSTAIGIEPRDIPTLEIDVEIEPHSSAERVTLEQHGYELLQGQVKVLTRREYLEEFRGIEDAAEKEAELDAEEIWITKIKPVVMEQELARRFAQFVVLGADGNFVGPGGAQVMPAEVLSANGQPPPPQPPQPPGGGIGQNAALQPQMPGLPELAPPGALPTNGLSG